mmetsp:Transcript_124123/g.386549  ORF Transcript_124123/g.386549 Transcript_124123/m.386549 type:complete len:264 (+) Transcript_124123:45-836(+)
MPHLLIDRIRSASALCPCQRGLEHPKRSDAWCAYLLEGLDILGGLLFVAGSVCFLPVFSHQLHVFLTGCALFVIGSLLYLGICTFSLAESVRERGFKTFEACENVLYLVGSVVFAVGTVMYWPPEAHHKGMDWLVESISLGVYFNLFTPEFEGTLLFILGSLLFVCAAFVNGLDQRTFDSSESRLLGATTTLYMGGSLLFVIGSVAFLPDMGCTDQMLTLGAWCFVTGSVLYVVGSCISLVRTARELRTPSRSPLRGGKAAAA